MKTLLVLLQEQKTMTQVAIEKMKEAEKAFEDHSLSTYPSAGTSEERIAYCNTYDRLKEARDAAVKAASRRLVSFGEFLGCKVEKKDLEYDYRIESRFHDLVYYCERLEKQFEYNVDSYNQYK